MFGPITWSTLELPAVRLHLLQGLSKQMNPELRIAPENDDDDRVFKACNVICTRLNLLAILERALR